MLTNLFIFGLVATHGADVARDADRLARLTRFRRLRGEHEEDVVEAELLVPVARRRPRSGDDGESDDGDFDSNEKPGPGEVDADPARKQKGLKRRRTRAGDSGSSDDYDSSEDGPSVSDDNEDDSDIVQAVFKQMRAIQDAAVLQQFHANVLQQAGSTIAVAELKQEYTAFQSQHSILGLRRCSVYYHWTLFQSHACFQTTSPPASWCNSVPRPNMSEGPETDTDDLEDKTSLIRDLCQAQNAWLPETDDENDRSLVAAAFQAIRDANSADLKTWWRQQTTVLGVSYEQLLNNDSQLGVKRCDIFALWATFFNENCSQNPKAWCQSTEFNAGDADAIEGVKQSCVIHNAWPSI